MDPRIQAAFEDELEKMASRLAGGAAVVAAGLLGGLAIYDVIKGASLPTIDKKDLKGMKGSTRVDAAKHIKKLFKDKPVKRAPIVVTKVKDVEAAMKALGENRATTSMVTEATKHVLKEKDNAFVLAGKKADVLVIPPEVHRAIVEHEIGHIRDKDEGNRDPVTGVGERLLEQVWKPTYEKNIMAKERRAWKHAPGYERMERGALGTYERPFHARRAKTLAPLALGLGIFSIPNLLPKLFGR